MEAATGTEVEGPNVRPEPLGWGFVGTGTISALVAEQAKASGSVRLVSVWGRDLERTKSFARSNGFESACTHLDELLADHAVEAVYVALPHALHVDVVLQALDAGKHVLCEKPLGLNAAEVQRIADHPASKCLRVAEGFMVRHQPQWRWITSIIDVGAIGAVRMVQSHSSVPLPNNLPKALPGQGSMLLDIGCYSVHLIRTIFRAEPLHVSALAIIEQARDSSFVAQLQFSFGWAQLFVSRELAAARRMHILGENGSIEVFAPVHTPRGSAARVLVTSNRPGGSSERQFPAVDQYGLQFPDFAQAVRNGTAPLVDLQNALANARCMDAIRRSFEQSGTPVSCN